MTTYNISQNAILETFEEGGLVLILPERRFVELNPTAVEILSLSDGMHSIEQIASEIAKKHDISHEYPITKIIQDVLELSVELHRSGVLEPQPDQEESVVMTTSITTQFLRNPDVVTREEDPDEGALLFNPDTNQVKVINTTGLFIWQQCGKARTQEEIIKEVKKGFEEVPAEQVAQDVQEFIELMLASGFIGIVEATK